MKFDDITYIKNSDFFVTGFCSCKIGIQYVLVHKGQEVARTTAWMQEIG
jgi:hypothetical protein